MTDLERVINMNLGSAYRSSSDVSAAALIEWTRGLRVPYCSRTLEAGPVFVVIGINYLPAENEFQLTASNTSVFESQDSEEVVRMYNEAGLREEQYTVEAETRQQGRRLLKVSFKSREDAGKVAAFLSSKYSTSSISKHARRVAEYKEGTLLYELSEEAVFVARISTCF